MLPMVTTPLTARKPPMPVTRANAQLLKQFISGPMMEDRMVALVPTSFSSSLASLNSSMTCFSRLNTFTTRAPVTVSSTMPFSSPSAACCSLNSLPVNLVTLRTTIMLSGMVMKEASVSCQLMDSIMYRETVRVMTPENSCVSVLPSIMETLSTSLVRRLISWPCGWESKKRSGSFCIRSNSS